MKSIRKHIYRLFACALLMSIFVFVSCVDKDTKLRVDALNRASYQQHYRSLSLTSRYACEALRLARSSGYRDGSAEALANLAFVDMAHMRYADAELRLDSISSLSDNQIELLVANVQHMRLCQRKSQNKEFYHYEQRARDCMRRLDEDARLLDARSRERLVYARSEYGIVLSTYLYYVGQREASRKALVAIDPEGEIVKDTAQTLAWLYNMGAGGLDLAPSPAERRQAEFDYLMRCYMLSRQYHYPYWEANALQALSEHLQTITGDENFQRANRQEIDYLLSASGVDERLLSGNLSERALALFSSYGDVYQTAGSWRTLSEAYTAIGDYPSALECLNHALADTLVMAAPDLVASIREQLSIVHSAMDQKAMSDYNRNIYLDLQEYTRQDRALEARAEATKSSLSQLHLLIYCVLAMTALAVVMIVCSVLRGSRHKAADALLCSLEAGLDKWRERNDADYDQMKSQAEDIEDQTMRARYELSESRRIAIEQRSKVSLAESVVPLIERMSREVHLLVRDSSSTTMREEREAYIRDCLQAIEQSNSLLTQWIKLRQGDIRPRIESFAVSELFDAIAKSTGEYQRSGITLSISHTDATVKADRTLTLFMLGTIASNARRYTPRGGTISISANAQSDYVEISIADTGTGMDDEQVANIFRPSIIRDDFQPHEGGHGFGLPSCRLIIEKYRKLSAIFSVCTIGCQSKKGLGTRFFFRLPHGVKSALLLLFVSLLTIASPLRAVASRPTSSAHRAAAFADSVYYCNIRADYRQSLAYADSCIASLNEWAATCNTANHSFTQGRMMLRGEFAESAPELMWQREGMTLDWSVVLDMRNEVAVAALALHDWHLYAYNNAVFTRLFRERSSDASLPSYVASVEKAETNARIAVTMLVLLLFTIFTLYYMLFYRKRLSYLGRIADVESLVERMSECETSDAKQVKQQLDEARLMMARLATERGAGRLLDVVRRAHAMLQDDMEERAEYRQALLLATDRLNALRLSRESLYVSLNIVEGSLSSLKHETMYYPSRLSSLLGSEADATALCELVDYYRLVYASLLRNAVDGAETMLRQTNVESLLECLDDRLRRIGHGKRVVLSRLEHEGDYVVAYLTMPSDVRLTPLDVAQIFSAQTVSTDFLVCRQIVRDIGSVTGRRSSGISAEIDDSGCVIVKIKISEEIWKKSKLS